MSQPAPQQTSRFWIAATAAVAVLAAIGLAFATEGSAAARGAVADTASVTAADRPCGAAADSTYLSTALAVAQQISAGESASAEVTHAVQTIEADRVLANAVATGDLAVVRSEVLALVFNHEHIVRLRVLRDGQVLDDLGGQFVLAPVSGPLKLDGQIVGTFVMSVQDDSGYEKLVQRLVGGDTVMTYQGMTVLSSLPVGTAPLPAGGTVTLGGVAYLVASFEVARFPQGELDVSLLIAKPAAAIALQSCAQVSADVLAAVAQRVYGEAITSPWWVGGPLAALARTTLAETVAAGNDAAAAQIVQGLVTSDGFAGLEVLAGGREIADAGEPVPLIAPITRPLVDAAGQTVGQAVFAVETAQGYVTLAQAFTGAPVLVRVGSGQLAGSFAGPPALPASGQATYLGVHYAVASFPAVEFPDVAARVYVLERE
jgi:hypothetical protein